MSVSLVSDVELRETEGGPVDRGAESADPYAGGTAGGKPIWTPGQIANQLTRTGQDWTHDNYGVLDDGTLNFGFWASLGQLRNSYYVNRDGTIAFDEAYYGADFSIFTPGQIGLATKAVGLWDDLISISFKLTSADKADITYGNTYTAGAQAYAYLPFGDVLDSTYQQYGFDNVGKLGGDVWIDNTLQSNFTPLDDSYYALTTMVHETGHALGLSHPGDYDATDDQELSYDLADYYQDTLQYSIMSYWDAYNTGAQYIDWTLLNFAYPSTPQVHDIAAIQLIYGADMTTRSDNTVYGFNSTADRDVFDFTYNTRPIVSIWDGGGTDTLDLSGFSTPEVIDLHAGAFSSAGGTIDFLTLDEVNANRAAAGLPLRTQETFDEYEDLKQQLGLTNGLFKDNISIAYGATIENATGGSGDDLIRPNEVANQIRGGLGIDTVSYDRAGSAVTADLKKGGSAGEAAGDKYYKIENLTGSAFNDKLTGNELANTIAGGAGNDKLEGAAGNDVLIGGDGKDVLVGGLGVDTLTGGEGADRFVFKAGDAGMGAFADVITDFQTGIDKIDLSFLQGVRSFEISTISGVHAAIIVDVNGDSSGDMMIDVFGVGSPVVYGDVIF